MDQRRCPSRELGWGEPLAGFHWEGDDPILVFHSSGTYLGCSKPAKFVNMSLPIPKMYQNVFGHIAVKHDRTGHFVKCSLCNDTITLFPNFDLSNIHHHAKMKHKEHIPIFLWDEEKLVEHFRWWDDLMHESRTGKNGSILVDKTMDNKSLKSRLTKSSRTKNEKNVTETGMSCMPVRLGREPLKPRSDFSQNVMSSASANINKSHNLAAQQQQVATSFSMMATL